jgi:broad specificity phosphatase PhoE
MRPSSPRGALACVAASGVVLSTTVLLVRHADVHNPDHVFYGRLPRFRISELGERQAAFVRDYLADTPIAAFYSSPMLRARLTARVLAAAHPGVPIRRAVELIEVRTGWMGAPNASLPARINLYEPPHGPDDETIEQIAARVDRLFRRLARRHAGQTVCCVSHGDPIVVAHALYKGLPLMVDSIRLDWYPQKCSVTALRFDEGAASPTVEYRDVIGELAPELKAPY